MAAAVNKLVFFLPDIAGGISSVLNVIVNQVDTVVLTGNNSQNKNDAHPDTFFNAGIERFKYHNNENVHHVCSRLSKLLPDSDAIIIANDWLELEMIARLALPNPVVLLVHGDYEYYYQNATVYQSVINKYIGVSERITLKLKEHLPNRSDDITYMPLGVEASGKRIDNEARPLKIIFPARLTEAKGYFDLFQIDALLKERHITVNWTIAGDTSLAVELSSASNFHYAGKLPHEQLLQELTSHDIYILPSRNEGFPVSLLEAMKTGLVPLITNFRSGIPEVVIDGKTGFVFEVGDIYGYANAIELLHKDRHRFNCLAAAAYEQVKNRFNKSQQKDSFLGVIKSIDSISKQSPRRKFAAYGSRLDTAFFPNPIVKLIRMIRMRMKK